MFEETVNRPSRWRVFWPEVSDLPGAHEAIRLAVWFVVVTLAVASVPVSSSGQNAGSQSLTFSHWSTFCDGVFHTAAVALGDLDGDGDLDVVFGNGRHVDETNWVFSNDGSGTFYGRRALGTGVDPTYGVALGDLDGDGAPDVVVANDAGHPSVVYLNDGHGQFTPAGALGPAREARRAVALGDLDGDGDLDAVLVGLGQDHLYLNAGDGRRWAERPLGTREPGEAPRATGVAVADVNGDRHPDIIVPGRYEGASLVYINDGTAGFSDARPVGAARDDATSVAAGDVDGDGDVDLVVGHWAAPHVVYLNDGQGHFAPMGTFGTGRERTWSVLLGDMDLDGDLDVVLGNAGVGHWAADLDGNGSFDRFGDMQYDAASRLYLNDGRGRFTPGAPVGLGTDNTRPVVAGDVDGDADLDLIAGNDCGTNHVFFNPVRGRPPQPLD